MRTPPPPSPVDAASSTASSKCPHRLPSRSRLSAAFPFVSYDPDPSAFSMHQYDFSADDAPVHSLKSSSSVVAAAAAAAAASMRESFAEPTPPPEHSHHHHHHQHQHRRPGLPPRGQRQSMHTLEELRNQMEGVSVFHSRSSSHTFSTKPPPVSSHEMKSPRKAKKNIRSTPSSPSNIPVPPASLKPSGHPDSSSSSCTVKSPKRTDHSELSAFPFPPPSSLVASVDQSLDSLVDARPIVKRLSIRRTRDRRNKSPSAASESAELNGSTWQDPFMPHDSDTAADDPRYPTPNLYDITLALNSEAGLDAWWSNTVRVLHTHFGAERAALAVPGDSTDLENVPWGQKATYSLYGYRSSSPSAGTTQGSCGAEAPLKDSPDQETVDVDRGQNNSISTKPNGHVLTPSEKRPPVVARHSFAGFGGPGNVGSRDKNVRPDVLKRTKSSLGSATLQHGTKGDKDSTVLADHALASSSDQRPSQASVDSRERTPCPSVAVFPVPRALEVESDPLIRRTGVVKLFGRTKPAVLTRQYSHDPMASPIYDSVMKQASKNDAHQTASDVPVLSEPATCDVPIGRVSIYSASSTSTTTQTIMELPRTSAADYSRNGASPPSSSCSDSYEEYEQIPQSPWSQSPAPSPAPISDPEKNPFFNTNKVDEDAFASSPPLRDYSTNQPIEAIGVDRAKTIIHIPLVHSSSSKQSISNTLRFPVAIISVLTSTIPYPANLRKSLEYLLPHLTTSFCLAQQYSQLERQLSTSRTQRFGHILGLGGTFSDASSEMELVAGLSNHVNYPLGENVSLQAHSTISSPLQRSDTSRSNSAISGVNTPGMEIGVGMPRDIYLTPGLLSKQTSEYSDSYFNLKQQPGGIIPTPPSRTPSMSALPQGFSRFASPVSIATQLHRELPPRPFPDTIAQLMLNSVPLHLFLAKPHTGEVIWTNDKFDSYRTSQPHEQRARDPWLDVHDSERENLLKQWEKALRSGSQFTERVRVKRYNDESAYRWFIFRANPLLSQAGELLYWIGSFLDVHEQRIAEMKAAQEREVFATNAKYKALANSIPQVVFEAAEYHGLISANEQWQQYTGQSLEDALNLGFAKHIHRDDLEKCGILLPPNIIPESDNPIEFGRIINSLRGSEPSNGTPKSDSSELRNKRPFSRTNSFHDKNGCSKYQGLTHALHELVEKGVVTIQKDENERYSYTTEIRLRSRGGDFRWHLVRLVKVETTSFGDGEASWYGTCTDINDRKLLERKLNREMESKTKFFSNMSHEIRTPLNGILGTIPFILDTQLDNDQRRMLDTIQNSSTNLRELVDNILDVSKVEAGKMNMVRQWFHVRSVVEDVIDTIGSRAIDKGLELNYLVEPDVPAMVIGDRFRIRQILINLMGNAVKFTSQGEIYTRCSIHRDPSVPVNGTEILLNFEVVDTGKGFSSTDAERLMQRFSQIEGSGSQQHSGSGLGLFLSKQLVEMHGGRLTPTSKEGQGAKFSFFVKVDAPPPPPPQDSSNLNLEDRYLQPIDDISPFKSPNKQEFHLTQDMLSLHSSTNSDVMSLPSKQLSGSSWGSNQINTPPSSRSGGTPSKPDQPNQIIPLDISSPSMAATEVMVSSSSSQNIAPALPSSYDVLIICPFDYAREALKQHIEQVIPLEVTCKETAILDVEDWKDLVTGGECPKFSHLVVCLPDANDVKETMQIIIQFGWDNNNIKHMPALIIVSDIYQKREISEAYDRFCAAGGKGFLVPKPVKPSSFSRIFDPSNQRDLSNDRNQDMAREINNSFKTMSKIVKEVIGNKGYRILLVEDDETNRTVMLKYLDKVKLASETAGNGQECIDMVFSKEPGYYSLIICDIQMPIKNGYETCQEIRSWEQRNHFPQIPIMALSANAMMDQIDDASRAGFNDYVTKPIKHNELGKMMMELLDPSVPQVLLRDRNK
ncbi:histidine kinase [Histoplasma capsulatum var. duboisii H88]|uniref:histidine kinase n=1 Tax=Ajellomyces capsulatus (strain H88) TaxID=544711 RepID=F0UAC2_AJEC8|nr:histidine kinase [Histoplasma capsulatum var. duboisii H88]